MFYKPRPGEVVEFYRSARLEQGVPDIRGWELGVLLTIVKSNGNYAGHRSTECFTVKEYPSWIVRDNEIRPLTKLAKVLK